MQNIIRRYQNLTISPAESIPVFCFQCDFRVGLLPLPNMGSTKRKREEKRQKSKLRSLSLFDHGSKYFIHHPHIIHLSQLASACLRSTKYSISTWKPWMSHHPPLMWALLLHVGIRRQLRNRTKVDECKTIRPDNKCPEDRSAWNLRRENCCT